MFKRYAYRHWGLFIPLGFRHLMPRWDTDTDGIVVGFYRRCLGITLRVANSPELRFWEIRVRVSLTYLP